MKDWRGHVKMSFGNRRELLLAYFRHTSRSLSLQNLINLQILILHKIKLVFVYYGQQPAWSNQSIHSNHNQAI